MTLVQRTKQLFNWDYAAYLDRTKRCLKNLVPRTYNSYKKRTRLKEHAQVITFGWLHKRS